ncbi:hypothetical protein [Pandoraea iniqua]|nr:hypothetical protein [Pandoraea iniqua]
MQSSTRSPAGMTPQSACGADVSLQPPWFDIRDLSRFRGDLHNLLKLLRTCGLGRQLLRIDAGRAEALRRTIGRAAARSWLYTTRQREQFGCDVLELIVSLKDLKEVVTPAEGINRLLHRFADLLDKSDVALNSAAVSRALCALAEIAPSKGKEAVLWKLARRIPAAGRFSGANVSDALAGLTLETCSDAADAVFLALVPTIHEAGPLTDKEFGRALLGLGKFAPTPSTEAVLRELFRKLQSAEVGALTGGTLSALAAVLETFREHSICSEFFSELSRTAEFVETPDFPMRIALVNFLYRLDFLLSQASVPRWFASLLSACAVSEVPLVQPSDMLWRRRVTLELLCRHDSAGSLSLDLLTHGCDAGLIQFVVDASHALNQEGVKTRARTMPVANEWSSNWENMYLVNELKEVDLKSATSIRAGASGGAWSI